MTDEARRENPMRCARFRLLTACAYSLYCLFIPLGVRAAEIWSDEESERAVSLDVAFKTTSLTSYTKDDRLLFPEEWSELGLFRLRFGLNVKHSQWMDSEIAYEHRARVTSEDAGAVARGGMMPSSADPPYRIAQLDWQIAEHGDTFEYRHEIDRLLTAWHPDWGEVAVGRQAIGLGRGALFSAVDIFMPFSPLEIDREWRRGVDAARIEYRLSDTSSAEFLAALGDSWDDSALLGRVRGYFGEIDGELIIGKRAEDIMYAGTMSSVVGGAEMHLELAIFDTDESHPDGGFFGEDEIVGKGVLGSSYTFDVGNGLTVLGEYHYSGFGVEDIDDATSRLQDPDFQERFLRGDTQILGQHAIALQGSYLINESWSAAMLILESPMDGSGLAIPSARWDATRNVTLLFSGYLPWGAGPSAGEIKSEYGATPISLFLQLSAYF